MNCFASRRLRSCRHVSCFMPCVSFRNLQVLLCGIIMHPSAFNTGSVALAIVHVTFVIHWEYMHPETKLSAADQPSGRMPVYA